MTRRRLPVGYLLAFIFALGTAPLLELLGLSYALSRSLPGFVYQRQALRLERGAIVLACLPASFDPLALERDYVPSQPSHPCGPAEHAVGKSLLALSGDRVEVTSAGLRVNGELLPGTAPRPFDSKGRPLQSRAPRALRVPPDHVWIGTHHPKSYDSRYYGAIPTAWLRARLRRLL